MRIERLAAKQKAVVDRDQLRSIGLSDDAIRHRVARGQLHLRWPRIYAVGRAGLTREGEWLAAVRTCGPGAVLSHRSAAVLWRFCRTEDREIEVSVPLSRSPRRKGIVLHRRRRLGPQEMTIHRGIPVTTPVVTVIDLATQFDREPLENAVNEAMRLGLMNEKELWAALGSLTHQPGARAIGKLLKGFTLTHSELGLVVETDGGAFHRTAAQQTRDRVRDQAHTAAGLTPLRFTHAQVAHQPRYVEAILRLVVARLDR